MATFKVGQRVRIIKSTSFPACIGQEGVIVRPGLSTQWIVDVPSCPTFAFGSMSKTEYGADSESLAPLTDPGADEFVERMKKLEREPLNVVAKEKA